MFNLPYISKDYLDICKKLYKDKEDRLKKYVSEILKPNELYIEIIGIIFKKAFL